MPRRIREFCAETGQDEPTEPARRRPLHPREPRARSRAAWSSCSTEATGADPEEIHVVGGGAQNELLCRWTANAAGRPVLAGPVEAAAIGNLVVQAIALGELALHRRGARAHPRRRSSRSSTSRRCRRSGTRPGSGSRSLAIPGVEQGWAREREHRGPPRRRVARRPLGRERRVRARHPRGARLPIEPARGRPCARQPGRREHLRQGARGGSPRSRDARSLGQGLGHRPRDDHAGRLRRAPARRDPAARSSATRWTTRRWSTTSAAVRARARPAEAVDRDAAPRVRGRAARRPHAPGRRHRPHLLARRATLAEETFGARPCGSTTSGPASPCRSASPSSSGRTRQPARCSSRSTGSSPGARPGAESYAATLEFVTRSAEAIAPAGGCALRPRWAQGDALGDPEAEDLLAAALPTLRGALLADSPRRRPQVDRSPEAVAFASSGRAPTVSQIGAPCPDHLIHTKHKPLVVDFDPAATVPSELRDALQEASSDVRGLVPRLLRAQPHRREPAVPDRPGRARASCSCPGIGIVTSGADAAAPGRPATSTTAQSPSRTRPTRWRASARSARAEAFAIEYWPLERYKLAQAPASRRARRTHRADRRRSQRHRPRDRPPLGRARRTRRRCRPEWRGLRLVAEELVAADGRGPRGRDPGRRHRRGRGGGA